MRPHPEPPVLSRCSRLVALFNAAMVLLLSSATVSPELHAWLHEGQEVETHACSHHDHAAQGAKSADSSRPFDAAHDCAVTLFSQGVLYDAVALVAQPCEGILCAVDYRAFARLALAEPRFLHLPPQAPPAV